MRLRFRLGQEAHAVDLAREGNGRWRVAALGAECVARLGAADEVWLEVGGGLVRAAVARDGRRIWVAAGGEVVALEEVAEEDTAGGYGHHALEVVSPIPGRVVKVLVAAGDTVAAGQVVVTVEAMKMENALRAEGAGRVGRVLVAPGDRVEPGQRLVELAPPA